jgi:hypothetical protein
MHTQNINKKLLTFLIICCLSIVACSKVDRMILNKGETPLAISADKKEIELIEKNFNVDGVQFTWTTGTNGGTDQSIAYTFVLDIDDETKTNPIIVSLGKAGYNYKYTVQELNQLLVDRWGITPGNTVSLKARVYNSLGTATTFHDSTDWYNVSVKTYIPVTKTLYLIGDAAPAGWSADNAPAMDLSPVAPGKFTWRGILNAGALKFITTQGAFVPSYNKGHNDFSLVYRTSFDQPDETFLIEEGGLYEVSIDLLHLTISIAASAEPAYSRLWMLGDAIPTGWNIDDPAEMRVDESNKFVFTYNEVLSVGEFKIPVATGNFSTDYYMPLENNPAISETGAQLVVGGSPDYKWKITEAGPYKIKLNIQVPSISIEKFVPFEKIYMVGDASPAGWNIDNPFELTKNPNDPYEFSFEGTLNVGEFKLPVEKGNWGGDFFMPVMNYQDLSKTEMKFVPGGSPDNKWKINEAGTYKIVINQFYETIVITKL